MKGLFLESKNQNLYFYNDNTGYIELFKGSLPEGVVLEKPINTDDIEISKTLQEVTLKNVKDYLYSGRGFRQLILEVSQQCNLRCKYCIYSDAYYETRTHTNDLMSIDTAKKAIDIYFKAFEMIRRTNPVKTPAISFYGGEPLLNFDLIKESIAYIEEQYSEHGVRYNVTTNGMLLQEEIAQYLVDKEFSISISIDGDKENHDRNRVTKSGTGSFDQVYNNLTEFRQKYPDYNKITINVCIDYASTIPEIVAFINNENLVVSNFTLVSKQETTYYDKFSKEDRQQYRKGYKQIKEKFYSLVRDGKIFDQANEAYMAIFGRLHINFLLHSVKGQKRNGLIKYTSTCVPGEKLYVSTTGVVHICERINPHFPIGTIDAGINYDQIAKYINEYNKVFQPCQKCPFTRLCTICFAHASNGKDWVFTKEKCERIAAESIQMIKDHINIMEDCPEEINKICGNHFKRINDVAGEPMC